MTTFAHELKASYAFMERNFFLTRRYWGWEIAFLIYSVAGALSISLIGADQGNPRLLLLLMVGAIVSIFQVRSAGLASTLPATSFARTWKVCAPSSRPV